MVLWDLLRIFSITLVSLTGLFLMGGLVAEASQRGLAPAQIISIIPLMIPGTLPYTIPATTLFATCNVYGRLAKDNEITALRAAGVNLFQIMKPAILLGVVSSATTFALFLDVIPWSFRSMQDHLLGDTNEMMYTLLKRQGCFRHPKVPYVIFVREVHGDRLIDAIFKRRLPNSQSYDTVARAHEAKLHVESRLDPDTGKTMNEIVVEMKQCVLCGDYKDGVKPALMFQNREFREPLPAEVFGDRDSPASRDVSWSKLPERIDIMRRRDAKIPEQMEQFKRSVQARPVRTDKEKEVQEKELREGLEHYSNLQKYRAREFRAFLAERHVRATLAFSCLCFALIGGPIGIWTNRADFLSSFIIGFLPTIMLYYPMLICTTNLAKDGRMPIGPAIWLADTVFVLIGILLCWRLVRR
jgi:lipopolysaccharide export system permease protein